jgi:Na+/melibiose symporter-like transporter
MNWNPRRMNPRRMAVLAVGAATLTFAAFPALAYVGPGAGLTLLGALWGLILAVVMSVAFVLFWPLRRLLRRNKRVCPPQDHQPAAGDLDSNPDSSMLTNPTGNRDERRL